MLVAPLNEIVPLRMLASDGGESLFGRINLYNSAGVLVSSLSALHLAEGLYSATWTPAIEGLYTAVGQFFFDSLFTIDADYEKTMEDVDVSTLKANIIRLLGLVQENTVIDNQVYDLQSNLTAARIRTYNSKTNALASGVTGLVASYGMTAAYSSGRLVDYKVVRDL